MGRNVVLCDRAIRYGIAFMINQMSPYNNIYLQCTNNTFTEKAPRGENLPSCYCSYIQVTIFDQVGRPLIIMIIH